VAGADRFILRMVLDHDAPKPAERQLVLPRGDRFDDRSKAHHKIHGRDTTGAISNLKKTIRIRGRGRHRLLDNNMFPGLHHRACDWRMQIRRSGNRRPNQSLDQ
jgi:hypothetical protein